MCSHLYCLGEEWLNSIKYAVLLQTHLVLVVHRFRSGSRGQVFAGVTNNPMAASAAPESLHNPYCSGAT
jgi:hypothetical protein